MKNPGSLKSLLWIMVFDHTSLNIVFPLLTLLFFDHHSRLFPPDTSDAVRSLWYGYCLSLPHILNLIFTPVLSALSDRYGRRNILLLSTAGAFLFSFTAGLGIFWGLLNLVLLGRVFQGAFSRTNPIAQAVIADISNDNHKNRNMGYLQCAISIGAFLGPILGGYFAKNFFFETFNFAVPFFFGALFAACSFAITFVYFKETHAPKTHERSLSFASYKMLLCNKNILFISLILLLSQLSWGLYYQYIPPVLKTVHGFHAKKLGLFVGLIAFWLAVATLFGIRFLEKYFSIRAMLLLALYFILGGLISSALCCLYAKAAISHYLIWVMATLIAMGDVIAYSALITLYSNCVSSLHQGKVMGICFIVVAFAWSLMGLLGGKLMSYGLILPMLVSPFGVMFAILLLHLQNKTSILLIK